jgi:hypothetical protein
MEGRKAVSLRCGATRFRRRYGSRWRPWRRPARAPSGPGGRRGLTEGSGGPGARAERGRAGPRGAALRPGALNPRQTQGWRRPEPQTGPPEAGPGVNRGNYDRAQPTGAASARRAGRQAGRGRARPRLQRRPAVPGHEGPMGLSMEQPRGGCRDGGCWEPRAPRWLERFLGVKTHDTTRRIEPAGAQAGR